VLRGRGDIGGVLAAQGTLDPQPIDGPTAA
jgi:hypothetical protein